ncbi:MAG: acyl-CoA transferase [Rhodospirillaceae bacterium]
MPSRRESVLQALLATLTTVPGATVERESAIPERVSQGGLIILRDGDPGTPEIILSPLTYLYDHPARLEVFVQAGQPAARAIALDGLLRAISSALAADRSLSGTCDWLAWAAPVAEELPVAGGAPIRAATVIVTLSYSTSDPLS